MHNFKIRELEDAPPTAVEDLERVKAKYRFIPNVVGVMANSPPLLKAYLALSKLFEETSLSPVEQDIVLLTVSVANQCDYCAAAHNMAARMHNVPQEVIAAIEDKRPLAEEKWEGLRAFAHEVVVSQGWPHEDVVEQFYDAGYSPEQALEVVLGVAMKTLSNYTNHLASTPLDPQFQGAADNAR